MKKLFSILLILALLVSFAVPVFAADEEYAITGEWKSHLGKITVKNTTEGGESVVSFSGIGASYHTAGIDVMPLLKELIQGKDSITVTISMDVKIAYAEDCEGDDVTIGILLRTEGNHERIKQSSDVFKEFYKDTAIHVLTGTNYGARIINDVEVSDEWENYEGELTFTPNDINAGLWSQLVLCFDNMKPYESIGTLFIKNAKITVTDEKAGAGKVTIDMEELNKEPELDPNMKYTSDEDTPALPEGNKLIAGTEWGVGLGAVVLTKEEFNGQPMLTVRNIKSEFATPAMYIYPSIKALMGDQDEISVWIVLDVRALSIDGREQPFGMKLRVPNYSDSIKDAEAFKELYEGNAFTNTGSSAGIYCSLTSAGKFTDKWQRIEIEKTFTKEDINDEFWTTWNLCFDQMKECAFLYEFQVKNVGIFLADEYEPIVVEEETDNGGPSSSASGTPAPPVIYNPIGFDKYGVTFTEGIDTTLPEGIVIDGTNASKGIDSSAIVYIVIGAGALALIAGALVTVIAIKKKNKAVKEEK
jgi:hypothetical protein